MTMNLPGPPAGEKAARNRICGDHRPAGVDGAAV